MHACIHTLTHTQSIHVVDQDILCHRYSVATALEKTGKDEVLETAKFVRIMDQFFDCLNVTNLVTRKQKRKLFQEPYRPNKDPSKEDFHLKVIFYATHCMHLFLIFSNFVTCMHFIINYISFVLLVVTVLLIDIHMLGI